MIKFTIEGYRNFKSEQEFCMSAPRKKRFYKFKFAKTGLKCCPRFLKTSLIYGAPNSGKSNFIDAINDFKEIITNQDYSIKFLYANKSNKEPITLEMCFFCANTKSIYQYGFTVISGSFFSEWLYKNNYAGNHEEFFVNNANNKKLLLSTDNRYVHIVNLLKNNLFILNNEKIDFTEKDFLLNLSEQKDFFKSFDIDISDKNLSKKTINFIKLIKLIRQCKDKNCTIISDDIGLHPTALKEILILFNSLNSQIVFVTHDVSQINQWIMKEEIFLIENNEIISLDQFIESEKENKGYAKMIRYLAGRYGGVRFLPEISRYF